MSAIFSDCGKYRYWLSRMVAPKGITIAYFGVNGSTAGELEEDHTTMKWRRFTVDNGGRKFIAVNPFAKTATDVRELAKCVDPIGPDNAFYLNAAIEQADILVPCWGSRLKIPKELRHKFDDLRDLIFASGKPVKTFGFTKSGDPKHPLMLPYSTQLISWIR